MRMPRIVLVGAHWMNAIAYQRLKSAEWWLRQKA